MNPIEDRFLASFVDELTKLAECATPGKKIRSKGKGKGLAIGGGKGPIGIPKRAGSITAKIEAARRDPSTKANPKDTGPKGSGTQDPRFKGMKFRKAAMEILKKAQMVGGGFKLKRGSSRVRKPGEPKPGPMRKEVSRFEAREMFKGLKGRRA